MEADFHTLDDRPGQGVYLVRVDVNSPLADGRPTGTDRFRAHLDTLEALEDSAAILLAHQGRPGQPDCVSLAPHAEIFDDLLDRPVVHVPDLFGDQAQDAVEEAEPGDVVVLENTRMYEEEKSDVGPENPIVQALAPLADGFVNDAFAATHRGDTSLVGFPPRLWSCAGRLIESEVRSLRQAVDDPDHPTVLVLGGAKVDDALDVAERMLGQDRADRVLVGGGFANLLLQADGRSVGAPNWGFVRSHVPDANQALKAAKALLDRYGDRIELPRDLALDDESERVEVDLDALPAQNPIHDIGKSTMTDYAEIVDEAGTAMVNGPMGVYEHDSFSEGTRHVFGAIAAADAFSVAGGGHTAEALSRFEIGGFDHVSTGGGASLAYLADRPMPALDALIRAKTRGS